MPIDVLSGISPKDAISKNQPVDVLADDVLIDVLADDVLTKATSGEGGEPEPFIDVLADVELNDSYKSDVQERKENSNYWLNFSRGFREQAEEINAMVNNPYAIIEGGLEFATSLPGFALGILNAGKRVIEEIGSTPVSNVEELYKTASKGMREGTKALHSLKYRPKYKKEAETAQKIFMAPASGIMMASHSLANWKGFRDHPNIKGLLRFGGDIAGLLVLGKLMKGGKNKAAKTVTDVSEKAMKIREAQELVESIPDYPLRKLKEKEIKLQKDRLEAEVQDRLDFIKDTYEGKNPAEIKKMETEIRRFTGEQGKPFSKPEEIHAKDLNEAVGTKKSAKQSLEFVDAIKKERSQKAKEVLTKIKNEVTTEGDANILDRIGGEYFRNEGSIDAYIEGMAEIGNLTLKDVGKAMKEDVASVQKRMGNKFATDPAVRKSGFFVEKSFSDAIEGRADISKKAKMWADITRVTQTIDQGVFGGAVQKAILWPARRNTLAKLDWLDKKKGEFARDVIEPFEIKRKKDAKLVGRILEHIESKDIGRNFQELLEKKSINKELKKYNYFRAQQLINAAQKTREYFDELVELQNRARVKRNQALIPYRKNYRPHVIESNLKNNLLGYRQTPKHIMEKAETPDFIQPNKPFNPRELQRYDRLKDYTKEENIITLLADYVDTAARDIFDTNVVHSNKIYSKVLKDKGLINAADAIDTWTAEVFAGVKPRFSKFAAETAPKPIRSAVLGIRRNLTRAVFPFNFTWNLFVQTTSSGITFARYGGKNSIKGLRPFFDKDFRKQLQDNSYSYIIKKRRGGSAQYQDIATGIERHAKLQGTKLDTVENYANFLTSAIENALTQHAIASAWYDGKTRLGLEGRALWEYASEGGAKTQSMYNYADLPGLLRAKEVGALVPFQTFCFEVMNTVREMNLPIIRKITKTGEYVTLNANSVAGKALIRRRLGMLARWTAAIVVSNSVAEKAIGRSPWQPSSFVPMAGLIFPHENRPLGVWRQYQKEFGKGVEDLISKRDFGKLRSWFVRYQVPAGIQVDRMLDGIEAVAREEMVDIAGRTMFPVEGMSEKVKAITMGPYRTEAGKEYVKERWPSYVEKLMEWVEKRDKEEDWGK